MAAGRGPRVDQCGMHACEAVGPRELMSNAPRRASGGRSGPPRFTHLGCVRGGVNHINLCGMSIMRVAVRRGPIGFDIGGVFTRRTPHLP